MFDFFAGLDTNRLSYIDESESDNSYSEERKVDVREDPTPQQVKVKFTAGIVW